MVVVALSPTRREAAALLEHVRVVTPAGAQRPWRSDRNLTVLETALEQGADPAELREFFTGAAELVRRGGEDPQWWYLSNMLTGKSGDRWRNEVADMVENDRRAAERDAMLEEAEREHDAQVELPLHEPRAVEDLRFRRVVADAQAAFRARWDADRQRDDEHEQSG